MNEHQKKQAENLATKYGIDPKSFIQLLKDFIVPGIDVAVKDKFDKLEKSVRLSERIIVAEDLLKSIIEEYRETTSEDLKG